MQKITAILIRMILITVLAIAVVLIINAFSNKDQTNNQNAQSTTGDAQVETGVTATQETQEESVAQEMMPQEEQEAMIEDYIRENISQLSPESEVLGGTFYVTSIVFSDLGEGEVQYEDGHIALTADFISAIDESNNTIQVELLNVRESS